MKRGLVETVLITLGLISAGSEYAYSQVYAGINRASENSASMRVGRVGGFYTGRNNSYSINPSSPTTLGYSGNGLGQTNFLGGGWRIGSLPSPALPQAFIYSAPGARIPSTPSPWQSALTGARMAELQSVSGLSYATSLYHPYSNRMTSSLPMSGQPYFAPAKTSILQEFFDLQPAVNTEPLSESMGDTTWLSLLQSENHRTMTEKADRAYHQFKLVTQPNVEPESEALSESLQLMQQLKFADNQEAIPCLLSVYLCVEKEQLLSAIVNMKEAVIRQPDIFVQQPDLEQFFGDPELIKTQAQKLIRAGDQSPDTANYILQAYAAWLLKDKVRLKETLDHFQEDEIVSKMNPGDQLIEFALTAALYAEPRADANQ